jgi:ankyrin repeat protein
VLTAANRARVRRSLTTDAEAQFIASHQRADGSWTTIDERPPQSDSVVTTTAVCANSLARYLPDEFKGERENRVRLAREWLLKAQPQTTEDWTYKLQGLGWTGASEAARKNVARQLLAEQHGDGGWSELPELASDAYSTGEVLVALCESGGVGTADPAYQRGVQFLLKSQQTDGSWRVTSRLHPPAPVSPPYVNTEFPPFQHDQFVSIMATSFATAALLHAIPSQSFDRMSQYVAAEFAPAEKSDWIAVSLNGNAAALKKLLDAGMSANSRTTQGTSALMLAARDPEKVKLLVERGADVNARAVSGLTPLMVASRYRGNAPVVRYLLKKGAQPNSEKGIEVRNDASALFLAVMADDVEIAKALVDAGARIDIRMKIIGTFNATPLIYASTVHSSAIVEYLLSKGADANEVDDDKISVLAWATIANRLNTVQTFLAHGAKVDSVDRFGMTPLLYAASINHGDTAVMQRLIAAGADTTARNKEGLTALELAKGYNHQAMVKLLAVKTAAR